jgi:hypothetical protein
MQVPAGATQIDAYMGSGLVPIDTAAATPDFWSYYGPWATAYAAYFGYQLGLSSDVDPRGDRRDRAL